MIDVYVTPVEGESIVVRGSDRAERFVIPSDPGGLITVNARGGGDTVSDVSQVYLNLLMGDGDDTVANLDTENLDVDLGPGNDRLTSAGADETAGILGGPGDDAISVGGDSMRVDGGPGDDTLEVTFCLEGVDLIGGEGRDTLRLTGATTFNAALYGGPGADRLHPGPQPDDLHFVPTGTPRGDANRDTVFGFADGADRLLIDGDADKRRGGVQTYRFVGPGTRPGAGQIMWYPAGGGPVVIGSDGRTVFEIKLEGFRGALDASDFRPR